MAEMTQGQKARKNLRDKLSSLGIGPTAPEVAARQARQQQLRASAQQGPRPLIAAVSQQQRMGPNAPVAMSTNKAPLRERTPVSATKSEQSRTADVVTNRPPEALPNNAFTQTDPYTRQRIAETQNQQSGFDAAGGAGSFGGAFRPRDTMLGRQALGLPTRAQRVNSGGPRILRQGQTRLNLPAANAERMAAADLRRAYQNAIRRNSSTSSAAVLKANTNLMTNQADNTTSRRGQDLDYNSTLRGQDVTARGQDINADVQYRGQDVTSRGQDLDYSSTLRGQDVTTRGQDLNYDSTLRGQDVQMRNTDVNADTSRYATEGANLRNRDTISSYDRRTQADIMTNQGRNTALTLADQRESLRKNIEDMNTSIVYDENDKPTEVTNRQNVGQSMALIGDPGNYTPEQFSNVQRNMPQLVNTASKINQYLADEGYAGGFSIPELKNAKFNNGKMGVFESIINGHWPRFEYIELPGGQRIPADFFKGMALNPEIIQETGINPGNKY